MLVVIQIATVHSSFSISLQPYQLIIPWTNHLTRKTFQSVNLKRDCNINRIIDFNKTTIGKGLNLWEESFKVILISSRFILK